MKPISITVPIVPVAQPRPRATVRNGHAAVYSPQTAGKKGERLPHPVVEFKSQIRAAFAAAYQGPPVDGPLAVYCMFVFPRPASMRWKRKPMPRDWHVAKPDRDNLDKAVLDALNGLSWHDDSQVAYGIVCKCIASGNEQPKAKILISELQTPPPARGWYLAEE